MDNRKYISKIAFYYTLLLIILSLIPVPDLSFSKFQLFEVNDAFTRARFKNLVEPFLRDIQGRRGIEDFQVVCDATNNTGEVVNRNEFVADVFVKPNRSINFISLNFIATRSGVAFSEVGGA